MLDEQRLYSRFRRICDADAVPSQHRVVQAQPGLAVRRAMHIEAGIGAADSLSDEALRQSKGGGALRSGFRQVSFEQAMRRCS
jgi:hypothetical protein